MARPFEPVTRRAADNKRVHSGCMGEWELGQLREHLERCPDSATFVLADG